MFTGTLAAHNKRFIASASFQWTPWSAWTNCDATCDVTGSHTKTRQCEDMDNDGEMSDIINCMGASSGGDDKRRRKRGSTKVIQTETKPCNATGCHVNGGWSNWSYWSDCSTPSGSGFQSRVRACDNPRPQHGGQTCLGDSHQSVVCHVNEWSIWGTWTPCDVTCGTGHRSRSRTCQTGNDCTGMQTGTSLCEMPSYGSWGAWTMYSTCSQSCGEGVSVRTRRCDNPAPGNGGAPCNGLAHQFVICNEGPCPIDGGWSNWTASTCSVTCGQGVQAHFRNCNNPTPQHGGQACMGDHLKFNHCGAPCAVDGVWSTWTNWTTCSVTSGSGLRVRMRLCANPAPKNGGVACAGASNETALCTDGSWSPWSNLTECSVTCGKGTQSRTRLCDSPAPQHGGTSCSGNDTEIVDCDRTVCPIDGGWSNYTSQPCSVTCGDGVTIAIRNCNNPSPAYGGQDCEGLSHKFEHCNIRPCPSVTAEQGAYTSYRPGYMHHRLAFNIFK
ncbi:CADN-like protein [Mya arenaria]|uniref:CADN-like protein n=1 Tax=Mya arenaria TaxID=6604 RepID=A0ABY7EP92_MYAAR|nr:CADN-like protein [Mya arenaria]